MFLNFKLTERGSLPIKHVKSMLNIILSSQKLPCNALFSTVHDNGIINFFTAKSFPAERNGWRNFVVCTPVKCVTFNMNNEKTLAHWLFGCDDTAVRV